MAGRLIHMPASTAARAARAARPACSAAAALRSTWAFGTALGALGATVACAAQQPPVVLAEPQDGQLRALDAITAKLGRIELGIGLPLGQQWSPPTIQVKRLLLLLMLPACSFSSSIHRPLAELCVHVPGMCIVVEKALTADIKQVPLLTAIFTQQPMRIARSPILRCLAACRLPRLTHPSATPSSIRLSSRCGHLPHTRWLLH